MIKPDEKKKKSKRKRKEEKKKRKKEGPIPFIIQKRWREEDSFKTAKFEKGKETRSQALHVKKGTNKRHCPGSKGVDTS